MTFKLLLPKVQSAYTVHHQFNFSFDLLFAKVASLVWNIKVSSNYIAKGFEFSVLALFFSSAIIFRHEFKKRTKNS